MHHKATIFVISGPSGSGKTTLHEQLLRLPRLRGKLIKPVSVTTRPLRSGERQHRDYVSVSREEFLKKKKRGEFLESQKVFSAYYGTPKAVVKNTLKKHKSVLLCIDVKGAMAIKKLCPDAVTIFIMPPSIGVLRSRLKNRLTEGKTELRRRLKLAKQEMGYVKRYDYVVVNDQLQKAVKQLREIIMLEEKQR